ncbi:MAG: hypothetical protein CL991_05640 [Euryarchaeota archaeon]|nr:hypothetical protein [Euryarchaeota archaeon]
MTTMSDLKSLLEERRTMVDTKATTYREARDGHNEKARSARTARDDLSGEVRELISEVKQQREVREQLNEIVRSKKEVRKQATDRVRAARAKIEESRAPQAPQEESFGRRGRRERPVTIQSLRRDLDRLEREFEQGRHTGKNEKKVMERMKSIQKQIRDMKAAEANDTELGAVSADLKQAQEEQEAAHQEVEEAASAAQAAHDLMLKWHAQVDETRAKQERAHRELRSIKREADSAHHHYIVSLRCLHSIQDMLRAMRSAESGESHRPTPRMEVSDLMGKLMSGETLSTDELMQLQRYD